MFSKARRNSRAQSRASTKDAPVSPLQPSFDKISNLDEALPSPVFPSDGRPSSADGVLSQRKSRISPGPPVLPPIPRVASTKEPGLAIASEAPSLPALNFRYDTDNISVSSRKSALRPQRSYEHFSRPRSAASTRSTAKDNLPLRDSGVAPPVTTYITMDPMFPRSLPASPLLPQPSSPKTRQSLDPRQSMRPEKKTTKRSTLAPEDRSRSASRSTTPNSTQEKIVNGTSSFQIDFDSPKMEASMFPSVKAQMPTEDAVMNRSFIDSRDRPYSQPKPRSSSAQTEVKAPFSVTLTDSPVNLSPLSPLTKPKFPKSSSSSAPSTAVNSPVEASRKSTLSSVSTIGTPFEATSAAFPPPQLVATRPKTEGAVSTVAGVQVPTHHTSSLKAQESVSSKADKRRTKLLNPMALLGRRKSTFDASAVEEEEKKAMTQAQTIKLPSDFDPRIKGKIVHDFSAPRQPKRDMTAPAAIRTELDDRRNTKHSSSGTAASVRKSAHAPIFLEHFSPEEASSMHRVSSGGIGAEDRENKDFLARFSQQSSNSTFSQESAILPPFARRSQTLDAAQASLWRDDEGSWSSGRDSGGNASSTNAPGDRESGLSAFSVASPATGRSSGSLQPEASNSEPKDEPRLAERVIEAESLPPLDTTQEPEPVFHAITTPEREAAPVQSLIAATSPVKTSPKQLQHSKRSVASSHRKSNASRFSFQLGAEGGEEKALEEKFRSSKVLDSQATEEEEEDYFDEDAMDDMDEMEIQSQMAAAVQPISDSLPKLDSPIKSPIEINSNAPLEISPKSPLEITPKSPLEKSPGTEKKSEEYYERDIPYVPNERELTYAEHPVFRTHSALADSRRTSYQSTLFDSYLASSSVSSPQRGSESRDRQASVTSLRTRDRSTSATRSSGSRLAQSPTTVSAMSPLPEKGEDPVKPTTPTTSPFSDFRFTDSPDHQEPKTETRGRADSETMEKPKWTRTADLWKQYSTETAPVSAPIREVPSREVSREPPLREASSRLRTYSPHNEAAPYRGSYGKGVRVRKPTGARESQRAVSAARDDMYYDDGRFDQDKTTDQDRTDEDTVDQLVDNKDEMQKNLQDYHQALADAANRAAAEGRFVRKGSTQPMTFDFGFEHDDFDDDIVAAANAEALANDADGFYGSEFGFYAKAKPGVEDDATNGGFFGEDGDDGLTRKRSTKEPNLTPITERSEFSTRNSYIHSAVSTPALSRMPVNPLTDGEVSFEQLRKLRQNAFGGSNGSLSQRSSPMEPQHSRSGSGAESVTYVREQENGQRWVLERRRTSEIGTEVVREVVSNGWI